MTRFKQADSRGIFGIESLKPHCDNSCCLIKLYCVAPYSVLALTISPAHPKGLLEQYGCAGGNVKATNKLALKLNIILEKHGPKKYKDNHRKQRLRLCLSVHTIPSPLIHCIIPHCLVLRSAPIYCWFPPYLPFSVAGHLTKRALCKANWVYFIQFKFAKVH